MGPATWLLCELDADGDTLFGLCDLGVGEPELGHVSLAELKEVSAGLAIGFERDLSFRGTRPISVYARAARAAGRIIEPNSGKNNIVMPLTAGCELWGGLCRSSPLLLHGLGVVHFVGRAFQQLA